MEIKKNSMQAKEAIASNSAWSNSLNSIAAKIDGVATNHKWLMLLLFAALYLLTTCYRASKKLFWFDEIFTIRIAAAPDLSSLWKALMTGVDYNPPLFYILTKAGEAASINDQLGARLPEVLGFGIFCLCLFRFISIRSSVLGGLVAMLFPLVTNAYWSAYEARPHGIVIGFYGIALVCWQQAAAKNGERRFWPLTGLFAALVLAVSNHAYGLLAFVPILIGESTRSTINRRIDLPVWSTLALAFLTSCASLIPLVQLAATPDIAASATRLWSPSAVQVLMRLFESYKWHLEHATLTVAVALLVLYAGSAIAYRSDGPSSSGSSIAFRHEMAALWGLMAVPAFAIGLSLLTGAPFYDRYGIAFVGGFAGFLGLAASKAPLRAVLMASALLLHVAATNVEFIKRPILIEPSTKLVLHTSVPSLAAEYEAMESSSAGEDLPIALLDDLDFATVVYYAPPALASRMTYLMQEPADFNGRSYSRLRSCCGAVGGISYVATFKDSHPRFLIYGRARSAHRVREILAAGLQVKMINLSSDRFLALASRRQQ